MKTLLAITATLLLLSSTYPKDYEKKTDEARIQSLVENYDLQFFKLKCENSKLKLLKKDGEAVLECGEGGAMLIENEGEYTNGNDQNILLLEIIKSDFKGGVELEKAEFYFDEKSILICLTFLDDEVIAYFKK